MAWTSPMTFVDGVPLTAAQMNTFVRDNMNETAPAKATTAGGIFVALGPNEIIERVPKVDRVNAVEQATSVEWTDLATSGPSVTVDTSSNALVLQASRMANSSNNVGVMMSWAVTGDTEIDPSEEWETKLDGVEGDNWSRLSNVELLKNLTPGTNTFTAKYRTGNETGTGEWGTRMLAVIPL